MYITIIFYGLFIHSLLCFSFIFTLLRSTSTSANQTICDLTWLLTLTRLDYRFYLTIIFFSSLLLLLFFSFSSIILVSISFRTFGYYQVITNASGVDRHIYNREEEEYLVALPEITLHTHITITCHIHTDSFPKHSHIHIHSYISVFKISFYIY